MMVDKIINKILLENFKMWTKLLNYFFYNMNPQLCSCFIGKVQTFLILSYLSAFNICENHKLLSDIDLHHGMISSYIFCYLCTLFKLIFWAGVLELIITLADMRYSWGANNGLNGWIIFLMVVILLMKRTITHHFISSISLWTLNLLEDKGEIV